MIAAGEAALIEPMLHGSGTSIDEMLNRFEDAILEANPTPETWGTSHAAQAESQAAESMWGVSPPTSDGSLWLPPGAKEPTIPDR